MKNVNLKNKNDKAKFKNKLNKFCIFNCHFDF